jgi:hypothetical protein
MDKINLKKDNLRKIGLAIAIGNIIMMFFSANYFLFMAKFPIVPWLFFNACFPSALIFLIGFFLKNRVIMAFSIPFLSYFGIGGLFVFSWSVEMIMAQISHIFMVFAIIYIILEIIITKEWKLPVFGFLAGLIAFLIVLQIHQDYIKIHPEYLKMLGDPKFEKIME